MTEVVAGDALLDALQRHFGHGAFKEGQRSVIEAVVAGSDVVVVMPTGGGKSLCYQLPALLDAQPTIVVSPLIALMQDQVEALRGRGIAAAALHSNIEPPVQRAVEERYRRRALQLLYVAPERLVRSDLRRLLDECRPARIVVDEAHCISEWGHDFRRDYLRIGDVAAELGPIQIVACTATATPEVRADIAARLHLRSPQSFVHGFARPNLHLSVERVRGEAERTMRLGELLDPGDGHVIVYAGTRRRAAELADHLAARLPTMLYHGDLPAEARARAQARFASGEVRVAVTTSAFGMGIDVPTVRQVIHVALPASLEEYYQQAGRAGRDGHPARCIVIHAPRDQRLQEFFIESAHPDRATVAAVYRSLAIEGFDPGAWRLVVTRDPHVVSLSDAAGDAARQLLRDAGVVEADGHVLDLDPAGLPVDMVRVSLLRRQSYRRLEGMLRYLTLRGCRHRAIQEHFGEAGAPQRCDGHCDVCEDRPALSQVPGLPVDTIVIRQALSAVARLNGRVGLVRLAGVLTGSRSRTVLSIPGVGAMPTYGVLGSWREADVVELLRCLLEAGAVRQTPPPYSTVVLTADGVQTMRGQSTLTIPDPRRTAPPPPSRSRTDGAVAVELSPDQERRFAALKTWRREEARRRGVPPYVVFPDRTLTALASSPPTTEAELLAVNGVGPAKLALYGADVLRMLAGAEPGADAGETS